MSNHNAIFIETTSIADYALKKEYRQSINSIIKEYKIKISSNYVRMELKKGVIANFVYLHNKIINCDTWSQVMEAIYKLSASLHRNKLSNVLEALQIFWSEIEKTTIKDTEYADKSLSDYIMEQSASFIRIMIVKLWKQIDKITDVDKNPMLCFTDIKPPQRIGDILQNSPTKCTNSRYECKIKEFIKQNQKLFEDVFSYLSKLPDGEIDEETKRRIKSLKEIIRLLPYNGRKFSNKEPNVNYCWNCSECNIGNFNKLRNTYITSKSETFQSYFYGFTKAKCNILDYHFI